jgi:hypothetical protein
VRKLDSRRAPNLGPPAGPKGFCLEDDTGDGQVGNTMTVMSVGEEPLPDGLYFGACVRILTL